MPTVIVNNKPVEIGANERLNCIQAAQRAGDEIPSYCWHHDLSVVASCRMCLVEVGEKKPDGTIAMQPKLLPGCQTPVKDGTVVISNSEKVLAAQKATLEYLLLNHPLDCPVCDQAGECGLQDYSYKYGRGYSRLQEPKNIKPDKDYIGDQITLFTDRCIMCTRCVRFTREISGTAEMQVVSRGTHEEIDIFPGEPCNNKLAGNVVDLCPVGALCSKDFLYEQRVWWLKSKNSVCPNCSTGCSITVDQNEDVLYRLKPRENPQAQGSFMCDEGRFGWKYIHSDKRLKTPEQRSNGTVTSKDWDAILPAVRNALQQAKSKLAVLISPWATVEEAYLLAKYAKSINPEVKLGLGHVRMVGGDDLYPKDVHGKPVLPTKFTIRAEKCPNKRGVEAVLKHFGGQVVTQSAILEQVTRGSIDTLYVLGGDPEGWIDAADIGKLDKLKTLIVQDLIATPASDKAQFVLAGAAWAEKDGTFVNHAGLAQAIHRGLRGPEFSRPDGRILMELAGRHGLFHASTLRQEIAGEIPALAALKVGDLSEEGVLLSSTGAATLQPVG
ncbi:molybdopterin-dependent oxidoreductase [Schlesneria paludicola]|uniref:molybdopterin-dependent oxidoreductase n=1 Tax=Schlesneria paludicola TaxID=360056 RepID=UPI00029AFB76|nr:molybdopterin-dependent oxidoreductase [Schlesneria paludicola]